MIAEVERRPVVAMPDPPRREPLPRDVGRVQDELGIRQAVSVEEYGPTSHLSEALLLRGYRNAGEDVR